MTNLLEVRNLVTKFYTEQGVVNAVNGISYTLDKGEAIAIVGESGSGKTVGVMSILGLIPSPPGRVVSGKALFNGRDIVSMNQEEQRLIRGKEIAMVYQEPMTSLNPVLTVGYQLSESLILHLGMSKDQAKNRAIELLDLVGIPDSETRLKDYSHQFSGGQRQRILIAMALACNPSILIADEPTTALDVTIQAQIVELVKELQVSLGLAIIWITHNLALVAGLVDKVAVMYAGYIVELAKVHDLYKRPLHPYTLGLLHAMPKPDAKDQKRLASIDGLPPDLRQVFDYCPFAARCPYSVDRCMCENPTLMPSGPNRGSACWRWEDLLMETSFGAS